VELQKVFRKCFKLLFNISLSTDICHPRVYARRKITESLGNVTVEGKTYGKSKGGTRWPTVCLSMYSITENIYYSQLSSVAILLQPEPNCFTSYCDISEVSLVVALALL
jgi:hypothetical protein